MWLCWCVRGAACAQQASKLYTSACLHLLTGRGDDKGIGLLDGGVLEDAVVLKELFGGDVGTLLGDLSAFSWRDFAKRSLPTAALKVRGATLMHGWGHTSRADAGLVRRRGCCGLQKNTTTYTPRRYALGDSTLARKTGKAASRLVVNSTCRCLGVLSSPLY